MLYSGLLLRLLCFRMANLFSTERDITDFIFDAGVLSMASHRDDMGYFLGGAFLGGAIAGVICFAIPELNSGVKLISSFGGAVVGLILGGFAAWASKAEQAKADQQQRQSRIESTLSPQIVGKPCRDCSVSIMFITDGHFCPACQQVICVNCEPKLPCSKCSSSIPVAGLARE